MKKFNAIDILNADICGEYTRNRIIEMWGNHPERSIEEISKLDVPVDDRLWLVSRLLPTDTVLAWAREFATTPDQGSQRIERAHHYWSTAKREAACAIALAVATTAVNTLDHVAEMAARNAEPVYPATWARIKKDILSVMLDRLVEIDRLAGPGVEKEAGEQEHDTEVQG